MVAPSYRGGHQVQTHCPRAKGTFLDPRTGEVRPRRCQAQSCGFCAPIAALGFVGALKLANPEYSAVVTLGDRRPIDLDQDVHDLRQGLRDAFKYTRNRIGIFEAAYPIELADDDHLHAHVLARGSPHLPDAFPNGLSDAGLGWSNITPIKYPGRLYRYVLKNVLNGFDLTWSEATEAAVRHLELNGGRMVPTTKGFWTDQQGRTITSNRAARRIARGGPIPPPPRRDRFS